MRIPGRVVLAVVLGVACGEANAPAGPEALAVSSGNGQFAFFGGALPAPLTVRVTTSGSQPFRGATVTWSVTAGVATLGTPSSTTDSSGHATTTVTVGDQAGPITVQAAVAGLTPVTFTASACGLPAFTFGATLAATLSTVDCKALLFYTDFYTLDLTAGQQSLTIAESSSTFDAFLELYSASGAILAFHDDIDPGVIQHSVIHAIVAPGDYVLAPSSYAPDITGAYNLTVVARPEALAGCMDVWVTRGVTVTDSVTTADCQSTGPYYSDLVTFIATAGSVVTIAERSTAFDAALFLYDREGVFIASNDDSANAGTTTDAYLVFTASQTNQYYLFVATADTVETGAYTLTVSPSATAGAAGPFAAAPALRTPPAGAWRAPRGSKPLPWSRRFR